ncbi:MAG: class I SAM-dependent methyltransferase [Clostridia bacterium]
MLILRNARYLATAYLQAVICSGDTVIDATMGNGRDTEMLAQYVGPGGHVDAFDVQAQAIERTTERLAQAGLTDRVRLHHVGHEQIASYVQTPVRAAVFNLGWLPGGDKTVTTRVETTCLAVEACLRLLLPGGVLSLCAYPGHAEGDRERIAVQNHLARLAPQEFSVLHHAFINYPNDPPELFLVQRALI